MYPSDAAEAAQDILDRLATHGLVVRRAVTDTGTGLGGHLAALATDLALNSAQQHRVARIAELLRDLAGEAAERDAAMVPPHLRLVPVVLFDGVVSLCSRRRT